MYSMCDKKFQRSVRGSVAGTFGIVSVAVLPDMTGK